MMQLVETTSNAREQIAVTAVEVDPKVADSVSWPKGFCVTKGIGSVVE